jgi:Zn finger protein HypA/HybF involved in hydrogenase expression
VGQETLSEEADLTYEPEVSVFQCSICGNTKPWAEMSETFFICNTCIDKPEI